jgi:hypothetical protein
MLWLGDIMIGLMVTLFCLELFHVIGEIAAAFLCHTTCATLVDGCGPSFVCAVPQVKGLRCRLLYKCEQSLKKNRGLWCCSSRIYACRCKLRSRYWRSKNPRAIAANHFCNFQDAVFRQNIRTGLYNSLGYFQLFNRYRSKRRLTMQDPSPASSHPSVITP